MNSVGSLCMGIYEHQKIHTKTGSDQSNFNTAGPTTILIEWHILNILWMIPSPTSDLFCQYKWCWVKRSWRFAKYIKDSSKYHTGFEEKCLITYIYSQILDKNTMFRFTVQWDPTFKNQLNVWKVAWTKCSLITLMAVLRFPWITCY